MGDRRDRRSRRWSESSPPRVLGDRHRAGPPEAGRAFVLARTDDRFTPDGASPARLAEPDLGNATAGFTDQLAFDDLGADDATAATRTAVFETVDGIAVTIAAWPGERGTWARISATFDEARARDWYARADGEDAPALLTPRADFFEPAP